jgi:hypothetical protein
MRRFEEERLEGRFHQEDQGRTRYEEDRELRHEAQLRDQAFMERGQNFYGGFGSSRDEGMMNRKRVFDQRGQSYGRIHPNQQYYKADFNRGNNLPPSRDRLGGGTKEMSNLGRDNLGFEENRGEGGQDQPRAPMNLCFRCRQ